MKNPQFIELYLTLGNKQKQAFHKYLASPYFNSNRKLEQALVKISALRDREIQDLKPELFATLYPGEEFTDVKLRLLFSDLSRHLKNFVFIEEQQSLTLEKDLSYIRYLRKSGLMSLFESQVESLREQLRNKKNWNPESFDYRSRLDMELLSYESFRNRFSSFNFQECSEVLEVAAMIKRLRIYLEQLSHESIGAATLDYPIIQAWVDYAESNQWSRYPEIKIYLLALKLHKHPERTEFFTEYLKLIHQYEPDFDFERGREMYLIALNYCIRKINQNNAAFIKQALDIYQHCIKHRWLLNYGVLSSLTYKNIIALCIRMNDLELANQLLEEYKNLVNPKDRNTIYHFNLAKIYKEQQEYSKALYLLNTSVFKDPLIELNARVEMIKIYYEIRETELMHNQIQATKNLIKRSKKLGYHSQNYSNFLNTANKLFTVKSLDKTEKEKWLESIRNDNHLYEKNWLYTMVDKIKSSEVLVS